LGQEPGRVLIPKGNSRTVAMLKEQKVEAIEIDVSEIMKGGGAIHCVTGAAHRETFWKSQNYIRTV
jgi:N-dimethylarginine dimethylaminohydrolase